MPCFLPGDGENATLAPGRKITGNLGNGVLWHMGVEQALTTRSELQVGGERKMKRLHLDRQKVKAHLKQLSLGDLIMNSGDTCFDDDFETKPTLANVGELVGVPAGSWHHWLYHGVTAPVGILEQVAAILGCDVAEILTEASELTYLRAERENLSDLHRASGEIL